MNASTSTPLSERDLEMLAFESNTFRFAGIKEDAIRDRFGLNAIQYYQQLNFLIDRPEAIAHSPILVGRLRRLRASRQRVSRHTA